MYSRLLYAKKREKNPGSFHQANTHACFIWVLLALPLPAIQIPLLDGINQSTLVYEDQGNLASALVVLVCGGGGKGGGAGYLKIVMTGMCGPNYSYKLT